MSIENHQIVVLTIAYHSHKALQSLCKDLSSQTKCPTKWIIVNNSPQSAGNINLNASFPISLIRGDEGSGFSDGCNQGIDELLTQGWDSWVWLLNPDIRLKDERTLERLLSSLKFLPLNSIVGTAVFDLEGNLEKSAGWIDPGFNFRQRYVNNELLKINESSPMFLDWVSGCNMLFRPTSHQAIPKFESLLALYYEDMDLCIRLSRNGSQIVWLPFINVFHNKGEGSQTSYIRRIRLSSCSYIRFLQRHRPGLVLFVRTLRIILNALFRLPLAPFRSFAVLQGCFKAYSQPLA